MHAEVESQVQPVVPCEPASELECPGRVGPFGLELGGRAGLEQQRRSRNRRADPAEAPPQITPQIEHTEMQARGRLDEHRFAHAGVASRAVRTYSLSSAIASSSRGPAVLSTITWSRAKSARICSAGRRWVRVARIAASSTAWRARLKPRNSRRTPRCTTRVTIRARGGVASSARTSTSRQEQAASSTTPRTTVAGTAGNWTFAIAPCANSIPSSVRLIRVTRVLHRHDLPVLGAGGDAQLGGKPRAGDDEGMVARRRERVRETREQATRVVVDAGRFAVHRSTGAHDAGAVRGADALMPQAHAADRRAGAEAPHPVGRNPRLPRRAGPGGEGDVRRRPPASGEQRWELQQAARRVVSSSAITWIARTLRAPVIEPPGNAARNSSTAPCSGASAPTTVETRGCTVA